VRLMPPAYVKPYVKRQKNDATDAEAICEVVAERAADPLHRAGRSSSSLHARDDLPALRPEMGAWASVPASAPAGPL
jgi:hypothetical protein